MQQGYQCPRCGSQVAFGMGFCGNCGTQLTWPTQQQPQPPPSHQQQEYYWMKSKAHLLLLSKFIHACNFNDFTKLDYWDNVLGEPSKQAIKRFVDEGMLITTTDLNDLLSYKWSAKELEDLLIHRNLPASGSKDKMIKRLMQADPTGMKQTVAALSLLKCTQRGHEIVEQYLIAEKENHNKVERGVMGYLTKRMLREACLAVAAYESEQVFSRGIGIDWKHYRPERDIETLKTIFESKPEIIAQLENAKIEALRIGAAMMELWGTNTAKKWLPADFETGLPYDNNTAARMFLFQGAHRSALDQYRDSGVEYVEILAADDSCDACQKLMGKQYKLTKAPKLPNPNCTHKKGCRCCFLPVV